MRFQSRRQSGVGLIEIVVAVAIVIMLMAVGLPSMSSWTQNAKIRTTAESLQNGLQLARAAAVQRNTSVRFQLVSTMTSSCALSTSDASWIVSLADPSSACDAVPSDTTTPFIIQKRDALEVSRTTTVAGGQSVIVFNGLGRVTPVPAGEISIDITNPGGGACAASGGQVRCLRVAISALGQVRMCDPARPSTDPQGC